MPLLRHRWDVTRDVRVPALVLVQGPAEQDAQEPVAVGAVKLAKDLARGTTQMTRCQNRGVLEKYPRIPRFIFISC